jgi:hypothetical protein
MNDTTNQVATFVNADLGIAATVTAVTKGFAVTLLDTDAEMIVATRIFPLAMLVQAVAFAKDIANV